MFVREKIIRLKGRGLSSLFLITLCFYMSPVAAQEILADVVEPARSDASSSEADVQTPAQTDTADVIIYKDQLPAEATNAESSAEEPQVQVDAAENPATPPPSEADPATPDQPAADPAGTDESQADSQSEGGDAQTAAADTEDTGRHIERFGSSSTEEWQMDLSMPIPAPARAPARNVQLTSGSLPNRAQNQQLQSLLGSLAVEPENPEVMQQLNALLRAVLVEVNQDLDAGMLRDAERAMAVIQPIDPQLSGLSAAQRRLRLLNESKTYLDSGEVALQAGQLIQPENNNAYYYFEQAKIRDPNSAAAELGLARVQEGLIARANEAANVMDFELAEQWLGLAEGIRDNQTLVDGARALIADQKRASGEEMVAKVSDAIADSDFNLADFLIIDLIALGGQEESVARLRAELEDARYYSGFQPGQIISDPFLDGSEKAPDIVIIPSGSFMMGSDTGNDNEKPRHRVNIERGFGFGVTEVTVSQFRSFVLRSGYRTVAEIGGSSKIYNESVGRLTSRSNVTWLDGYNGERANINAPVIHVSWHDAQAYVKWLSSETGKKYRLPTEAEYEYVARAGGNSTYWWGEGTPSEAVENLTGEKDESPDGRQWTTFFKGYSDGYWGPAPVASFQSQLLVHPFGVYDITGNVSEWVEDCWHSNYSQAPDTNAAWVNLGCERRVARGGYWASAPSGSRATYRISANPNTVGPVVGIRIARDL